MQAARLALGPKGRAAGGVDPLPPRVRAWAKEAAVRHMHEHTNWEGHTHFGPVRAATAPASARDALHHHAGRDAHAVSAAEQLMRWYVLCMRDQHGAQLLMSWVRFCMWHAARMQRAAAMQTQSCGHANTELQLRRSQTCSLSCDTLFKK